MPGSLELFFWKVRVYVCLFVYLIVFPYSREQNLYTKSILYVRNEEPYRPVIHASLKYGKDIVKAFPKGLMGIKQLLGY